jgi:hypothetical protein
MSTRSNAENGSEIKREMEQMKYEPLLKVEKSLILWSLILGAVLMVILVWVSYTFFPGALDVQHSPRMSDSPARNSKL